MWAPWRSEYLRTPGSGSCLFCDIASAPEKDRENLVLHRGPTAFVLLNRYPYINGHLMIVPHRHVPDLRSLERTELDEITRLLVLSEEALSRGMECMGMNGGWNLGGCAGAGVKDHIHVHMLPRWDGDSNFMTTVGGSRVLSESLEDSFERLRPWFEMEK
jgi:ATP adenylyltransferase